MRRLAAALAALAAAVPVHASAPTARPAPRPAVYVRPYVPPPAEVLAVVAKAEDPEAAEAVMWVVLNRARATGRTVLAVASAHRQFHGWRWVPAAKRWTSHADRRQLARLRLVARAVLRGEIPDPTGGARFFHRVGSATPEWAPEPHEWRQFGRHFFYGGRHA